MSDTIVNTLFNAPPRTRGDLHCTSSVASGRPRHRGGATAGLIASLVVLAGLTTAAFVFRPQPAGAAGNGRASLDADQPLHPREMVTRSVASLLGRSHAVLAVHERGASPYLEIVLWVEDRDNRGRVDPAEVAVLAHSRVLQTLTWFSLPAGTFEHQQWSSLDSAALDASLVASPGFCDRWRAHSAVAPRVIATGISDVRLSLSTQSDALSGLVNLALIWPADSTDSPTETSAQAHVALPADPQRSLDR